MLSGMHNFSLHFNLLNFRQSKGLWGTYAYELMSMFYSSTFDWLPLHIHRQLVSIKITDWCCRSIYKCG